jgi:hypothetical protein
VASFVSISLDGSDGRFDLDLGSRSACVLMGRHAARVVRRDTATLLAYIAEIDHRKLYLEHAYPSMFAFCTKRFHMSEAVAARRIRAGRATCRFPCILGMVSRGEPHLSGIHQLALALTLAPTLARSLALPLTLALIVAVDPGRRSPRRCARDH